MDSSMFRAWEDALGCATILFFIFVPLGVWKFVEIAIWVIKHVRVVVQ